MSAKTGATVGLTERHMHIICMAFASLESEPKVDLQNLTALLKLGSKASAATRYSEARRALKEFVASVASDGGAATTPRSGTGDSKKRARKRVFDNEDDDMEETPVKTKSDSNAKGKKKTKREGGADGGKVKDEDDQDETLYK
ncbi:hypothetical protein K431DRAFT_12480 [Polychaeton citri CBS 116435]|uniref:Uncharacterized protein n=1 Tax=Polychaeton citri CBS 116435 TaxID=1314669 RepID=A0A9P4Q189_9PEZI|nr:hypothetical protein K431DRAFT_12480 [Polychaeton citri CBS 116435]